MPRKLTEDERAAIVARRGQGETPEGLAECFEISVGHVYALTRHLKLPKRSYPKVTTAEIEDLLAQDLTQREIASRLGVSPAAVSQRLRRVRAVQERVDEDEQL